MKFQDFFSTKISYPFLYPFLVKDCYKLYEQKKQVQFLNTQEIKEYQIKKLRNLLIFSFENTRYYKNLFEKISFDPYTFSHLEDMRKIPILTRKIVNENTKELVSDKIENLHRNTSGGSTGNPVIFYADKYFNSHAVANAWVADSFTGWTFGSRTARLWGLPKDYDNFKKPWVKIRQEFTNVKYFDAFDMSLDKIKKYHRELTSFRPEIILTYASSIFLLAKYLKENKIKPLYPTKAIITSAEKMYPEMRNLIEEVFGKIVFDRYGSREVSAVSMECPKHKGFHLMPDDHYIETVDPKKTSKALKGKEGLILVTVLNNFGMPFIRYQIGDIGVLSNKKCSCGRKTDLIEKITGRVSNTIVLENGKMIHGEFFTHAFYYLQGVEKFKFIQESFNKFAILIVKNSKWKDEDLNQVYNEIFKAIDKKTAKITVKFVKSIPPEKSGKYLFTVSKVKLINFKENE